MEKFCLEGKQVLITNGPTQEALDPVRYISNHSTGKMGNAIAEAFLNAGAYVTMVAGPIQQKISNSRLTFIQVKSATEMLDACLVHYVAADIIIFAAAVSDYRPAITAMQKIKKQEEMLQIAFVKNPDVAMEIGKRKKQNQLSIGFALETEAAFSNAMEKMQRKRFDMIVLNSLTDEQTGFGFDTNKVTLIFSNGHHDELPLLSKFAVAERIVQETAIMMLRRKSGIRKTAIQV